MNFQELYEPYATKEAPNVSDQIKWLQKQGFPQNIIDQALLVVYTELEKGKIFVSDKHSSAWNLWMYIKGIATDLQKQELEIYVKNLEEFHSNLSDKIDVEWNKLSKSKKIWEVLRGRA